MKENAENIINECLNIFGGMLKSGSSTNNPQVLISIMKETTNLLKVLSDNGSADASSKLIENIKVIAYRDIQSPYVDTK